eukprot:CAMPEP_0173120202 /NCGR_PEP_ID=MMETSP1102-20130122/52327_1 /TAXON_ID=49646 /ORGANISM="Geminigera sp., Strain Caron Lab Isolate" /LENGTH=92 /DNA_ID=CAMNT_0014026127 /DNA_START=14 /DNA_END=288 /DNA_ORIENTATION=+
MSEWGERMYDVLDAADNSVAFYLEADTHGPDNWFRRDIVDALDVLIAEQESREKARLIAEQYDSSLDARYLRSDLCRTFLTEGALLEELYGG